MSEQDKAGKQEERLDDAFSRLEKRNAAKDTAGGEKLSDKATTTSPVGMLAMLLALVAIGIGSYAIFMLYTMDAPDNSSALATEIAEIQTEIRSSKADVAGVVLQINGLKEEQDAGLESLKANLQSRLADLESTSGTTSQDWVIAEVEYLLRMANQRILMEQDAAGALAMFRAADQIVADAQGLTAFSLREAMAADIASLEAVKKLDREGLYLRISALLGQVAELKQRQLQYRVPVEADVADREQQPTFLDRLTRLMLKAGNRIASLIDYRRNEIEITPILPPKEEYYLRQNLVLKLQMAQLALLDQDGEIFSVSLGESIAWINRYFDPDDVATTAMRSGLEELKTVDVQQDMPDVTASLREVRLLLGNFQQAQNKQ